MCLDDEYNLDSFLNLCLGVGFLRLIFFLFLIIGNDWRFEKLCIMIGVVKNSVK
jgi:hypothetical protein